MWLIVQVLLEPQANLVSMAHYWIALVNDLISVFTIKTTWIFMMHELSLFLQIESLRKPGRKLIAVQRGIHRIHHCPPNELKHLLDSGFINADGASIKMNLI